MNKKLLHIILGILLFIVTCYLTIIITNHFRNPYVTDFKSCFDAGYPIMESYPLKCSNGENIFVENISSEGDATICPLQYDPVCAKLEIQCITTPCEAIYKTFQNECFARNNEIVHQGECNNETMN